MNAVSWRDAYSHARDFIPILLHRGSVVIHFQDESIPRLLYRLNDQGLAVYLLTFSSVPHSWLLLLERVLLAYHQVTILNSHKLFCKLFESNGKDFFKDRSYGTAQTVKPSARHICSNKDNFFTPPGTRLDARMLRVGYWAQLNQVISLVALGLFLIDCVHVWSLELRMVLIKPHFYTFQLVFRDTIAAQTIACPIRYVSQDCPRLSLNNLSGVFLTYTSILHPTKQSQVRTAHKRRVWLV